MWPNPQFPADLVKLTEEILNGKFQFLCSGLIFYYKHIISLAESHVIKTLYSNVSGTHKQRCLNKDLIDSQLLETTSMSLLVLSMPEQP